MPMLQATTPFLVTSWQVDYRVYTQAQKPVRRHSRENVYSVQLSPCPVGPVTMNSVIAKAQGGGAGKTRNLGQSV